MNYLMGFFLVVLRDEEAAYRCFSQLLDKSLLKIFIDGFSHLQGYFYILDRMINLFIPDLWEHFKVSSSDSGRTRAAGLLQFGLVHHSLHQLTAVHPQVILSHMGRRLCRR